MRRFLAALGAAVTALVAVLVVNALRLAPPPAPAQRVMVQADTMAMARRLAGALRFATISRDDGQLDSAAFRGLHAFLADQFPRTHATLSREVVAGLSLAYTWRGRDPAKAPVVLMGHLDVVPVIAGTEGKWTHPPFGGDIADRFVWGRGAMDDKSTVLAVMEGIERLVADGFVPSRTIILAFGHDEEIGGKGAQALLAWYRAKGWPQPALVLDEGGFVTTGMLAGVRQPVAMVGIAEKGFQSVDLTVETTGGHSSMPSAPTTIGRLARAITRLEDHPFPATLDGPTRRMMEAVAPAMGFGTRLAIANLWLTEPLVRGRMLAVPTSAAMLRTTTAPTIVGGGEKENVIPPVARATVNFRIRPGETGETVLARVREIVADTAVRVTAHGTFSSDPSPVSDPAAPAFRALADAIRETVGDAPPIVAPYLVPGGTDARH